VDMHLTGLSELVIPGTRPDLLTAVRSTWRPNLFSLGASPSPGPFGKADKKVWPICVKTFRAERR